MFDLMSIGVAWGMCHFLALFLCIPVLLFLFFTSVFVWCVPRTPIKGWVRIVAQVVILAITCAGFMLTWSQNTTKAEACQQNFYGEANVQKGEVRNEV